MAPLSIAAAVLAVVTVQLVGLKILPPLPSFSKAVLGSLEPAIVTAALVSGAVLVFAMCVRWAVEPVRSFRRIALAVLILSFLPNFAAAMLMRPAVDWPSMIALMSMHAVAWAVSVLMLTTLTVVHDHDDDARN